MKRHFSCALVTGASSGLGAEFAIQLADQCDHLILVARRAEPMEQLAAVLRRDFSEMMVTVIPADLSVEKDRTNLASRLADANLIPDLLINNAGLGNYGAFITSDWNEIRKMLDVNMTALTHLSHLFAPQMAHHGDGAIVNVSSLASTLPIPDFGVYAATKAYVSSFTEALRIELKDDGVDVMALCPGPVKTEFGDVARRGSRGKEMRKQSDFFYVPKEQVVADAINGLNRRRARVFPGIQVAAAGLLFGALPIVLIRMMMSGRPRR